MEAKVWWFSGTGNSHVVASRMAASLAAAGWSVGTRAMEAAPRPRFRLAASQAWFAGDGGPDFDPAGMDLFVFPVFSFSTPALVDRFLARLPVAMGRRAAVVVTMGGKGYEGRALVRAARRLRESGRKVVLTEAIEMPEAFVQFAPATGEDEAALRTQAALLAADRLAAALVEGKAGLRTPKMPGLVLSWIASVAFGLLGRRMLGLTWSASRGCNACGLCATSCPAKTIHMAAKRPVWGFSCEDCQRCANACPVGAIRISVPRLVLVVAPAFFPWGRWLESAFGLSPGLALGHAGGGADGDWRLPLWIAGLACVTAAIALLLRLLDRIPATRGFLSLSFAANFRRRLAPGFREVLGKVGHE